MTFAAASYPLPSPSLPSPSSTASRLAVKALTFDPVEAFHGVRQNGVVPVVLFVVAIIILLALAAAVSIAVLVFCAQKGMNFDWYVKTSLFEVKVACKR